MKIQQVSLYNFAKYSKISVDFSDNITYLVGGNGAGKSTIGITAIWFVLCGIAEKSGNSNPLIGERFRFIGPASTKAQGQIIFKDEKTGNIITCTRTLNKSGSNVEFKGELPGVELNQEWLTSLFNEFLIAPKRFQELPPLQQAKAIGIDTSSFDREMSLLKSEATTLRGIIKTMGDLTPIERAEKIDIQILMDKKSALQNRLLLDKKAITDKLNALYLKNKEDNKKLRNDWDVHKTQVYNKWIEDNSKRKNIEAKYKQILEAFTIIQGNGFTNEKLTAWVEEYHRSIPLPYEPNDLYLPEPIYTEERPDDKELMEFEIKAGIEMSEIMEEIQLANLNNQNALVYSQYLQKVANKKAQEDLLTANLQKQEDCEKRKIDYIKSFDLPFDGMAIDEEGGLTFQGRYIREPYFSSGECLKIIVTLMSRKNPELKYVFLQDFQLMDEERQKQITDSLESLGFQLVIEYVGKSKMPNKSCILLKDCKEVESYDEIKKPDLM